MDEDQFIDLPGGQLRIPASLPEPRNADGLMAEVSGGGVTLTFFGDDADAEAPSDPSSPRGKEAVGRVWMPLDAFVANIHHLVAMVEDLREQD